MSMLLEMVNTTAEIQIKGPNGEELTGDNAVKIRVQSLNTISLKTKAVEAQAFIIQANKTNNTTEFAKLLMSAEKSSVDLAAAAVVGWNNDKAMGAPYTPEYCKQMLSDPRAEFIRKQINEFIGDQNNFFVAPATGSSEI